MEFTRQGWVHFRSQPTYEGLKLLLPFLSLPFFFASSQPTYEGLKQQDGRGRVQDGQQFPAYL